MKHIAHALCRLNAREILANVKVHHSLTKLVLDIILIDEEVKMQK